MLADWIGLLLSNFGFAMFLVAVFFMLLNRLVTRGRVPQYEIVYRWIALFPVGVTGVYTFVMHVFYPDISAATIGWSPSPFQYEVGIADLGFGVLAILSFNASYGFRLATTLGNTVWLWGDAIGHIHQIIAQQNFSSGNAGTWFWMDIFMPVIMLLCILKLRRTRA